MKKYLLPALFVLIRFSVFAQGDSLARHQSYIINQPSYTIGVYRTFEEFKYNRPSIRDKYTYDSKSVWIVDSLTNKETRLKPNEVWGFSDGTKVFISWGKNNELLELGRYCYFREKGVETTTVAAGTSMVPLPIPYNQQFIINFNTGAKFQLTKKLMKKILKTDDLELYTQFKKESAKKQKLLEYIVRYNDRNADKIR